MATNPRIIYPQSISKTLAVNQTISPVFDLIGNIPTGMYTDSNLTGTSLTFSVSLDNVTFVPLKNQDGTSFTLTVSGAGSYAFPLNLLNFRYLKVISGTLQATNPSIISMTVRAPNT